MRQRGREREKKGVGEGGMRESPRISISFRDGWPEDCVRMNVCACECVFACACDSRRKHVRHLNETLCEFSARPPLLTPHWEHFQDKESIETIQGWRPCPFHSWPEWIFTDNQNLGLYSKFSVRLWLQFGTQLWRNDRSTLWACSSSLRKYLVCICFRLCTSVGCILAKGSLRLNDFLGWSYCFPLSCSLLWWLHFCLVWRFVAVMLFSFVCLVGFFVCLVCWLLAFVCLLVCFVLFLYL